MAQGLEELALELVQRLRLHNSPEDFNISMFE
jgi:hypothetical protein